MMRLFKKNALRDLSFIMFLSIYSMMVKSIIVVSCVSWRPDKSEAKQKDKTCFAFEKVIQGEKSCPRYIGGKGFVGEIKKALSNTKRESDDSTAPMSLA